MNRGEPNPSDQNKATRGGPTEIDENPSRQREAVFDPDRADRCGTEQPEAITESEVETIEERSRLPAMLIYEIVRRMGEEEMARPVTSLRSGLAAGLSISLPVAAEFAAANLRKLLRLWAIVFAANLTGLRQSRCFAPFRRCSPLSWRHYDQYQPEDPRTELDRVIFSGYFSGVSHRSYGLADPQRRVLRVSCGSH
jgi:hypothetical protein